MRTDELNKIRYFFLTTGSTCFPDWSIDSKTGFTLMTETGAYETDFDKLLDTLVDPEKKGNKEYRAAEKFISTICTLEEGAHTVIGEIRNLTDSWDFLKDWSIQKQNGGNIDLKYHQLAEEFVKDRDRFAKYCGFDDFNVLCETLESRGER